MTSPEPSVRHVTPPRVRSPWWTYIERAYIAAVTSTAAAAFWFDTDMWWTMLMVVSAPFGFMLLSPLFLLVTLLVGSALFGWWADEDVWVGIMLALTYAGLAWGQFRLFRTIIEAVTRRRGRTARH